jgi:hypothetical protein
MVPFYGLVDAIKPIDIHVQVLRRALSFSDLGVQFILRLLVVALQPIDWRLRFGQSGVQFLWRAFSYGSSWLRYRNRELP